MKPLSAAGPDFARRMTKLSTAVEKGRRDTISAAALAAKRAHLDVIRPDSGGDLRLSGVGKRGAKVGARFDIVSGGAAVVKATGPMPLLANRTRPHMIPRANRRGRTFLSIPGIGVRSSANHPGSPGKDSWKRGQRAAQPKVTKVMRTETQAVVKRAIR